MEFHDGGMDFQHILVVVVVNAVYCQKINSAVVNKVIVLGLKLYEIVEILFALLLLPLPCKSLSRNKMALKKNRLSPGAHTTHRNTEIWPRSVSLLPL